MNRRGPQTENGTRGKALLGICACTFVAVLAFCTIGGAPNSGVVEETTAIENTGAKAPDPKTDALTPQTVGVDEAYVGLQLENAYIKYLGQNISLPSQSLKVSLRDGLKFQAIPDTGYEISGVRISTNDGSRDIDADDEGFYQVQDSLVTSALTVYVDTKKSDKPAASSRNKVLEYATVVK